MATTITVIVILGIVGFFVLLGSMAIRQIKINRKAGKTDTTSNVLKDVWPNDH